MAWRGSQDLNQDQWVEATKSQFSCPNEKELRSCQTCPNMPSTTLIGEEWDLPNPGDGHLQATDPLAGLCFKFPFYSPPNCRVLCLTPEGPSSKHPVSPFLPFRRYLLITYQVSGIVLHSQDEGPCCQGVYVLMSTLGWVSRESLSEQVIFSTQS